MRRRRKFQVGDEVILTAFISGHNRGVIVGYRIGCYRVRKHDTGEVQSVLTTQLKKF